MSKWVPASPGHFDAKSAGLSMQAWLMGQAYWPLAQRLQSSKVSAHASVVGHSENSPAQARSCAVPTRESRARSNGSASRNMANRKREKEKKMEKEKGKKKSK